MKIPDNSAFATERWKKMNPDFPIVSVVMAVYNGDKYLSDSIVSILNQTFTDFEFIIITANPAEVKKEL